MTSSSQEERAFVPISVAAGIIYDFANDCNATLTLRYSERAPTPAELYARGPHDATFQFLIGDPNLGLERALGVDIGVRKKTGLVTGSLSAFYNYFFSYIESTPTGVLIDGLQASPTSPSRRNPLGGEGVIDVHLLPPPRHSGRCPARQEREKRHHGRRRRRYRIQTISTWKPRRTTFTRKTSPIIPRCPTCPHCATVLRLPIKAKSWEHA